MQKKTSFSLVALTAILAALIAFGGVASSVSAAQATAAATMAGTETPIVCSGLVTGPSATEAQSMNGAGATFPAVLYSKMFSEYNKLTNVKVNYQAIGSGGGIKAISDQTVDFGASDGIMTAEQLKAAKGGALLHIPTASGSVAMITNIPEATEQLKLTPETLPGIYLGEILKWNDPKLVADNPSLKDVDKYIVVVHRADGSGTTNIFTSYLAAVSETWAKTVGAANAVNWPVGLGGKGNDGVAGNVKQTPYSVGYVELAYADQNKLPIALLKNKAGNWVGPTVDSTTAAAVGVPLPADMKVKLVNSPNPEAYPIVGFTWLLVYDKQTKPDMAEAITRLTWWMTHDGQQYNEPLLYGRLSPEAIKNASALIKSITINGKPAAPADIMACK